MTVRPRRLDVHQQGRGHEQHVQDGPRRPRRHVRTDAPRRASTPRSRRTATSASRSSRCRPNSSGRTAPRSRPPEDRGHRLPEGQGTKQRGLPQESTGQEGQEEEEVVERPAEHGRVAAAPVGQSAPVGALGLGGDVGVGPGRDPWVSAGRLGGSASGCRPIGEPRALACWSRALSWRSRCRRLGEQFDGGGRAGLVRQPARVSPDVGALDSASAEL